MNHTPDDNVSLDAVTDFRRELKEGERLLLDRQCGLFGSGHDWSVVALQRRTYMHSK